ncbi:MULTISPECIES: ECF transporter S component [unclassified Luteococcus]|uniref:ECF transporter S component n=1 Tax=unclassified Luteococcus TaxID=2639923 RepID=UPI00313A8887
MDNITEDHTRPVETKGWRVVDIVVAAVLGVAVGLIFFAFNNTIAATAWGPLDAVLPGLAGLIAGVWFLGGPLGGLIIRKPGAALLVELLAATVSVLPGNKWGITTLYSGLAQGIGAEIVFAIFAYKRWKLPVAAFAGIGAAVGAFVNEFILGNYAKNLAYNATYLVCLMVSGAVLAGGLAWLLTRALASAGALNRFEAGNQARRAV